MNLAKIARHCARKPGTVRDTPFGPDPVVYKATNRIFAFLGYEDEIERISLKCDPDRSLILRTSYAAITPGYHLNKTHWNTIALDGSVPDELVLALVDHSYELVYKPSKTVRKRAPRRRSGRRPRSRSGG